MNAYLTEWLPIETMENCRLRALTKLVILPFVLLIIASCGSNGSTDNATKESTTTTEGTSVVSDEQSSTTAVEQPSAPSFIYIENR